MLPGQWAPPTMRTRTMAGSMRVTYRRPASRRRGLEGCIAGTQSCKGRHMR